MDRMYYLAKNLDDCTVGNSEIFMDWGNCSVVCKAVSAGSPELKTLLVEMARDYVRLRDQEAAILKAMKATRTE